MKTKRPEMIFHFRGVVERGSTYRWRDGYSENSPSGGVLFPWSTRAEARREAKEKGCIARFYRGGLPE